MEFRGFSDSLNRLTRLLETVPSRNLKNPFGPSDGAGVQAGANQRDLLHRWTQTNNHSEGTLKRSRAAAIGAAANKPQGPRGPPGWPHQRRGQREEELLLPSLHRGQATHARDGGVHTKHKRRV